MRASLERVNERMYKEGCQFNAYVAYIAATYNVGDWILVSGRDYAIGVKSVVGKIVSKTERLFVIRSEVGGYCTAYSWIDTMIYPNDFKKLSLQEAMDLVKERYRNRF